MRRATIIFAALLAAAIAVLAACGGGADAPAAEVAAEPTPTLEDGQVIPVEALPDPLPDAYIFRDTAAVEREMPTETIYVVLPGDTLAGIAAGYCITVEEIQRLNNIVDAASLGIGDELRIPLGEGSCGVAAPQDSAGAGTGAEQSTAPRRPPGEVYVVEPGDTLVEIAESFGFTWSDVAAYNNLSDAQAGALQVGQELIIPPQSALPAEEEAERSEPPG